MKMSFEHDAGGRASHSEALMWFQQFRESGYRVGGFIEACVAFR